MANENFYRSHEAALQTLGEQIQSADYDSDSGDEDEEASRTNGSEPMTGRNDSRGEQDLVKRAP